MKGDQRCNRAILQMLTAADGNNPRDVEANEVISANDDASLADYLARLGTEVPTSDPKVDKSPDEPPEPFEVSNHNRSKQ